jgi:hypothetical protein
MRYSAEHGASNRVGRNSGAGPGGVSRMVPTERERERGLEPLDLDAPVRGRPGLLRLGLGLGALAVAAGAGVAAYAIQNERRRRRSMSGRLQRMVGWIS